MAKQTLSNFFYFEKLFFYSDVYASNTFKTVSIKYEIARETLITQSSSIFK